MARLAELSPTTKRLLKYLPFHGMPSKNIYDPRIIKFNLARSIVANYDYIFDRFVKNAELSKFEPLIGFAMKEKNTIVEKWPFRLKLQPGQPGAQEEFDRLLSGGVSGKEIYLEWKRTRM
ncbi:hypothetical protein M7I_7547 [Glarea lozoyensis 74030]|uniref:Uncharacterized protein n=1 Tax=Glarea lozoyensis (strain ATCC 74030 / MF5533) TaxID=1104152 RepID=H0EXL0_GLAL7|nr:hypothetical protein M7I_7547 [Glarea lozoyensis 74030]